MVQAREPREALKRGLSVFLTISICTTLTIDGAVYDDRLISSLHISYDHKDAHFTDNKIVTWGGKRQSQDSTLVDFCRHHYYS